MKAPNGRQGLELLTKEQFHLLFLDYMMSVMDGGMMLRVIEGHSELKKVPVVMMSCMSENNVAERCWATFYDRVTHWQSVSFRARLRLNLTKPGPLVDL